MGSAHRAPPLCDGASAARLLVFKTGILLVLRAAVIKQDTREALVAAWHTALEPVPSPPLIIHKDAQNKSQHFEDLCQALHIHDLTYSV